jgi:hypothetical protein
MLVPAERVARPASFRAPSIKGLHRFRGTAASQDGGQLGSKLANAFEAHDVDSTRL